MTEYTLSDDLSLALTLAANADLVSLDRYRALDLVVTTKPDRTPVTDADQAVERGIRSSIEAARPGDSILGEEYGTQGDSSRQWIIDPIDGTANFLRGVPIWGTLVALAIDGVPVVGVVSSPALGKRWWAATGHGAWVQEHPHEARRLAVSEVAELSDASLSYNSLQGWDGEGRIDQAIALSRSVWRSRAIGDMWSYMLLAEGALDIVAEFDLKPYDMAALIPIITEAGGRFSSADGQEGPWRGQRRGDQRKAPRGSAGDAFSSLGSCNPQLSREMNPHPMTITFRPARIAAALAIAVSGLALAGCVGGTPTTPISDDATHDVFSIEVGYCLNGAGVTGEVSTVPIVDCSSPHDREAYASGKLPDGDYPGTATIQTGAETICGPAFTSFIGLSVDTSIYDYTYYTPTENSWASGDREVMCVAFARDHSQITGSLKGINK